MDVHLAVQQGEGQTAGPVNAPGHSQFGETIVVKASAPELTVSVSLAQRGLPHGEYALQVNVLQPSSLQAQALQAEYLGGKVYYQNPNDADGAAVTHFDNAARFWQQAGDVTAAELAEFAAAIAMYNMQDFGAAGQRFAALQDKSFGDSLLFQSLVLTYAGRAQFLQGDLAMAREYLERAMVIQEEHGFDETLASTSNNLALLHHSQGNIEKAEKLYLKSLALYESVGDQIQVGTLTNNLGGIRYSRGLLDEAIAYFSRSLAIHESLDNTSGRADAFGNIGFVERARGNQNQVISNITQELAIRQLLDDRSGMARAQQRLGEAYAALGAYDKAIEMFNAALAVRETLNEQPNVIGTLHKRAQVLALQGRIAQSLDDLNRARSIAKDIDMRALTVKLALTSAITQLNSEDPDALAVVSQLQEIKSANADLNDALIETRLDMALASAHLSASQFVASADLAAQVYDAAKALKLERLMAQAVSLQAVAYLRLDDIEQAQKYTELAQSHWDAQLSRVQNPLLRAQFRASQRQFLEAKIEIALRQDPVAALDQVVAMRSTLLGDFAERSRSTESVGKAASKLSGLLARRDRAFEEAKADELTQLNQQIAAAMAAMDTLQEASVAVPSQTKAQDLVLAKGATYLTYFFQRDQGHVWIQRAGEPIQYRMLAGSETLTPLVTQGIAELRSGRADASVLQLSQHVLAPVLEHFNSGHTIVVDLDGPLFAFPFAALLQPDTRKYLVEDFAVKVHQAVARSEAKEEHGLLQQVLLLGDPVFDQSDPRLPRLRRASDQPLETSLHRLNFTRYELEQIANVLGDSELTTLQGTQATKRNFLGMNLRRFDVLHLATHGIQNPRYPELAHLALSRVGDPATNAEPITDWRLSFADIIGLNLQAGLVVLSACETNLGKYIYGEGLLGLSYAFLAGGAESVLGTHWRVADHASAAFMARFYTEYSQTMDVAKALRATQIAFIQNPRTRNTDYWAGYVHYATSGK